MTSLFDPSDPRPIHFLGIGGAGMSALALAALRRGISVSGCDADTAAFADLAAAGAQLHSGHSAEHLAGVRAVVVTAAVSTDNPELEASRELGLAIVPRKVALASLVNGKTLVGLAGTHGKTTTTVMTTIALAAAGLRPSGLAGGRVEAWGGNARLDSDQLWVVEADEYDQAFLTLEPTVAVINNVEADHLECYGSVAAMEEAFVKFATGAEHLFVGTADDGSDRVAAALGQRAIRFGFEDDAQIRILPLLTAYNVNQAAITWPDGFGVELKLAVPGDHNLRNATAALAVVRALGGDVSRAADALSRFAGVGRRFERLGQAGGIDFVDDYAHHPTELEATLKAARSAFPEHRIVAVFQPHLYSRTREHHVAMGHALTHADVAIITDVYPAREQPIPGITGKLVADAAQMECVHYVPDRDTLEDEVESVLRECDAERSVLITLGAGDVTRVGRNLLNRFASRS